MPETSTTFGNVFITGSSTGIGRACALHLARVGFSVIAGVRKETDAQSLREVAGGTEHLRTVLIDVADESSVASAAKEVEKIVAGVGLLGLINNAGIGVVGPVEFVALADWRKQFEVNVIGQVSVTQAMLPLLREFAKQRGMGSAKIINIGSIAGRVGQPMMGPYCASKHAMEAISDALRIELADQGIQTTLFEPGAVQSEIWRKGGESVAAILPGHGAHERYGKLIGAIASMAQKAEKGAVPAEHVAVLAERCLLRKKAPARIVVGRDAKMAAIARRFLPDRMFDWMLRRAMGLK